MLKIFAFSSFSWIQIDFNKIVPLTHAEIQFPILFHLEFYFDSISFEDLEVIFFTNWLFDYHLCKYSL